VGKNVAVFVDVANIFYAAKAAGVDIDYVTLLKSATAGRDFVRAYAYTGLDPDNENQRNFHQFLARHQYKVVSKDIRKYGDGKVKANLDIELVVDLMKTARNLDVAVIVSGDGDFASAIRAVQEMGVRVEVISFRGNTSSDLMDVADLFTDITHIAKVDKGSTRSGRRVADDDEDLSMTEVPDKMTEGTGRGRGRGRGGRYSRDEAPAASRSRSRTEPREAAVAAPSGSSGAGLVALPGEKLSRATAAATPSEEYDEPEDLEDALVIDGEAVEGDGEGEGDGRRRRRRRGGRGRGRGRRDELGEGTEGGVAAEDADGAEPVEGEIDAVADLEVDEADLDEEAIAAEAPAPRTRSDRAPRAPRTASGELPTPFDDLDALAAPRPPRSTPFGSVWGQQLGSTARPASGTLAPLPDDDEDLDEPEIPEYLLAERRNQGNQGNRGGNRGGGGRGGRNAAYAAAIDRERYGGGRSGGGSSVNRYGEPARGGGTSRPPTGGGGGNRGGQAPRGPRNDRPAERFDRAPRSSGSNEPWSEVPPELEELLMAQMAKSRPAGAAPAPVKAEAAPRRRASTRTSAAAAVAQGESAPAEAPAAAPAAEEAVPAPKRRTSTRKAATAAPAEPVAEEAASAPKRRTSTRTATAAAPAESGPTSDAPAEAAAPKKRTTTRKAATAAPVEASAEAPTQAPAEAAAPRKRASTRKKATDVAEG